MKFNLLNVFFFSVRTGSVTSLEEVTFRPEKMSSSLNPLSEGKF
jgi:hypothetical protein